MSKLASMEARQVSDALGRSLTDFEAAFAKDEAARIAWMLYKLYGDRLIEGLLPGPFALLSGSVKRRVRRLWEGIWGPEPV